MPETYTVIMRGEIFTLTRDQVEFDSPNYFTSCFLGEFAESQTRTVTLSRDPDLFRVIVDYLTGYKVLPLHASALPKRMGMDAALFNLLADAQFYLLDGLVSRLKASKQETVPTFSQHLPSHVIISKACMTDIWSAPVPIPAGAAQELNMLHQGLNEDIVQTWNSVKPCLDKSLQTARLPTSYSFLTLWRICAMSEIYTVIMRGETFTLNQDQVGFDSPNYFTSCFLGEFAESHTRTVTLSRDPELFRIILDYLSGYEVLPLHESAVPRRMGLDVALRNLLIDARFYLLSGLISQINASEQKAAPAASRYVPSHVQEDGEESKWGSPVPIPAETAQELKAQKGFNERVARTWEFVKAGLDESLQTAQLPTSYSFITSWTQHQRGDSKRKFYYVLRLIEW
ncbi:hypothetical protein FRC10_002944 [Ceratobasidium sp. 414]|nr:hypothetical protein FRC10_002944 [Ceratobasidium sp. 414]